MSEYRIRVTETLSRLETVEAESEDDALDYVRDQYAAEQIILDADDYDGVEFEVD